MNYGTGTRQKTPCIVPKLGAIILIMGMIESSDALATALFPRARARLLSIFFGQPERSFYSNELVRLVGSGIGGVQRELQSLSEGGLLQVSRLGNQKHYQANPQSPIFSELCSIVAKTFGVADVLRAALLPLGERIKIALIYGSVAKGQTHAESDIDLMLVGDDLRLEEVFVAIQTVEPRLGRKINPTLYTCDEFNKRRKSGNPFLTKVLAGKTIMLMGELDAFDST